MYLVVNMIFGYEVFEGTYEECQDYLDQHPEDCAFGTLQIYTESEFVVALQNASDTYEPSCEISDVDYDHEQAVRDGLIPF